MKIRVTLALVLFAAIYPIAGCGAKSATVGQAAPATLAPGYINSFDQIAGQTLAAAHAGLVQATTTDFTKLTLAQQQAERPILTILVNAINTADAVYLAYHAGNATQAQVQAQLTSVAAAQTQYTNQAVK